MRFVTLAGFADKHPHAMKRHLTVTTRQSTLPAVAAVVPIAAMLILGLAGCSKPAPPAPQSTAAAAKPAAVAAAPTPMEPGSVPEQPPTPSKDQENALMHAIFGDAYDPAQERASGPPQEDGSTFRMRYTFQSANALPDGRTAVIVNSVSLSDDDGEFASHGTEGTLNVYLLRQGAAGWEVLDRHEDVASMGSNGFMGGVTWLLLGPGKPGFAISSGGVWQGYAVSGTDVFELRADGVQALGTFQDASSNSGACGPGAECWDVGSSLRLADTPQGNGYRDLLVNFKGKFYTVTEDKGGKSVVHLQKTVRQTARYRFNGKEYVLAAGTNPVPQV
jgi:hypothetical protein